MIYTNAADFRYAIFLLLQYFLFTDLYRVDMLK